MKPAKPQKAVIYARVSSAKQKLEGDGLASQETRCREFASYRNLPVIEVFRDDASGGSAARPGMKALLGWLRKNRGAAVLIDDLSRLARSVKAHMELRAAIAMAGGVLMSPTVEFGDDADSELQEYILATVAQHQRRKNAEQTKNRMRARAQNGYWVFHAPIGYKYERVAGHGKMLVPKEPLASIVREAFEGYASGRFDSLTEVKRFLESRPAFPRNSNDEVHIERVVEIFSRPAYAGHITIEDWGLRLVPAKHKPLISLATWQAVQNRHLGNAKAPARADISDDFPLRGFVSCGHCGQPLTACWSKGRSALYPYYLCDTRGCPETRKSIRRDVIETEFETLLNSLQPTEGLFNVAFAMFRDLWDGKLAGQRTQGGELKKELALIERKVDALLDRIVDADSDSIVKAYEKRIRDLETQKAVMRNRIANCGRPLASFSETYRTAFDFLANPCRLWHSEKLEDRRAVLKLVFAERLTYVRGEGYRTAQISMPFKLMEGIDMKKNGMVPLAGIEPALLAELDFESSASTNSATGAPFGRADYSDRQEPVNLA
jgi:site-specific DNA recombinase